VERFGHLNLLFTESAFRLLAVKTKKVARACTDPSNSALHAGAMFARPSPLGGHPAPGH
jgi:hypothetical protein